MNLKPNLLIISLFLKTDVDEPTLLDSKRPFQLTIPYKASDVRLENISLPPFLLEQGLGSVLKKL